jgi:hypothetical protein
MPKPAKGARLGGSAAHEKILLTNLARQLFEHGRITTTEAKARRLRPGLLRLSRDAPAHDDPSSSILTLTSRSPDDPQSPAGTGDSREQAADVLPACLRRSAMNRTPERLRRAQLSRIRRKISLDRPGVVIVTRAGST